MILKILQSAHNDFIDGYWFYEKQENGLGSYFIDSLFSDIDSLLIYHGIHPIIYDDYYRMLSKRFPFAVYYKIMNDIILVYSVLDCRRNPAWIRDKLK